MKNKKIIVLIAVLLIITVVASIGISKAFFIKTDSNTLISGTIKGNAADFKVIAMYLNNEEVTSMSQVPYGSKIDTTRTFCYTTSSDTPDTNVEIYTNSNGEHVFNNLQKNEKCNIYFTYDAGTGLAAYVKGLVGTTGTDAVTSSSWGVVADHPDEARYIGKNPDNYVEFNSELWRIIGVFDTTYCKTGSVVNNVYVCTEEETKPLVKIIRNNSFGTLMWDDKATSGLGSSTGSSGSNDWSDSQLMMLLNPVDFRNSGYLADDTVARSTKLSTINGEYISDGTYNIYRNMGAYFNSALTVYKPAKITMSADFTNIAAATPNNWKVLDSTAQSMIATTKWNLGGWPSNGGDASLFYNKERNNGVYAARPTYWYGKVGLMYPSDYGYATYGGSTYDREACINYSIGVWNATGYQADCAYNDWLLYVNTLSSIGTAKTQWTITPGSSGSHYVFTVNNTGYVGNNGANGANEVRPVLYLETGTEKASGSGTYGDPYILA